MGVEPYLVASVLEGVLAQRLVRLVCVSCRKPNEPDLKELRALGVDRVPASARLSRGAGCDECRGTGYRGRTGIYEFMPMTEETAQPHHPQDPGTRDPAAGDRRRHDDPAPGRLAAVLPRGHDGGGGPPRDPRGHGGVVPVFAYRAADRAGPDGRRHDGSVRRQRGRRAPPSRGLLSRSGSSPPAEQGRLGRRLFGAPRVPAQRRPGLHAAARHAGGGGSAARARPGRPGRRRRPTGACARSSRR